MHELHNCHTGELCTAERLQNLISRDSGQDGYQTVTRQARMTGSAKLILC